MKSAYFLTLKIDSDSDSFCFDFDFAGFDASDFGCIFNTKFWRAFSLGEHEDIMFRTFLFIFFGLFGLDSSFMTNTAAEFLYFFTFIFPINVSYSFALMTLSLDWFCYTKSF